jgi:hypothetical protein
MKNNRKSEWKNVILTPDNIDEYMEYLYNKTKGQYITQGVSFNKDDAFQMDLLKKALLTHNSFSGLVKHLLSMYFSQQQNMFQNNMIYQQPIYQQQPLYQQSQQAQQPIQPIYQPIQQTPPVQAPPVQETFKFDEDEEESKTQSEPKIERIPLPDKPKVDTSIKSTPKTTIKVKTNRMSNPFLKPNPNAKPST